MARLLLLWVLFLPGALCALPTHFTVSSYDLKLSLNPELNVPADGVVEIKLSCATASSEIVLHWGSSLNSNLTVGTTDVAVTVATVATPVTAIANKTLGLLTITRTDSTLFAVNDIVTVTIKFQTKLNDDNKGLFYRPYQIENGHNNFVIMTNLRPTFARELFPCLDEPQLPASLTLTLTYPSTWVFGASTAASGTPTTNAAAGTSTVAFTSIKTPPNNFAFFLATNMTSFTSQGTKTSLVFWSRIGIDPNSLTDNARFLSSFYHLVEDTIGTDLVLSQIHVVMVPGLEEPFSGYGVIFIREENYAQDYSSPQMEGTFKSTVAPVVYQFIRQYSEFSSRPTSWSDYWVSQAIGNYLRFLIFDMVFPMLDFKTDLDMARQNALYLDAQPGAKPLQDNSVNIDLEASVQATVSDPLKSLKGAAILNMLDQSLPAGSVFKVIQTFLAANKETPVTSDKFITALKEIATKSILSPSAEKSLTYTLVYWATYNKIPLETVRVFTYTGDTTAGMVNFTTTAFCSVLVGTCDPASLPTNFYVAATVGTQSDNRYYILRQDLWPNNAAQDVTTLIDVKDTDWVVANMKSAGYYRSNYTSDNWDRLTSALSSNDGRLLGRSQLLDDAFSLAMSTPPLNYNVAIGLGMANLGNMEYKNWVPVQRGLREIGNSLMGLAQYSSFKSFAAGYFSNLNAFLQNSSSDAFEKARIQSLFLDEMCEYDITGYRSAALGNLTDLLKGTPSKTVPSSLYDGLACCGARYNSTLKAQTLWNILYDYKNNYYSRRFASIALGCLSNYTDVAQYYDIMIGENLKLKPYIQIVLENVAEKNSFVFLKNFTQRINKFQTQLGAVTVASLIRRAGRRINSTQAAVLNGLSVDTVVASAIDTTQRVVTSRAAWLSANTQSLVASLQTNTLPSGSSAATVLTAMSLLLLLPFSLFMLATVNA